MREITYCENTINVAITTYHVGINSVVKGTKNQKFRGILGALKAEFAIGSLPFIVAIATGAVWYLLFSSVQLFMLCSLPVIIFAEGAGFARSNKKHRQFVMPRVAQSPHLRGSPLAGTVPPSIQTEPFLQVVTLRVH